MKPTQEDLLNFFLDEIFTQHSEDAHWHDVRYKRPRGPPGLDSPTQGRNGTHVRLCVWEDAVAYLFCSSADTELCNHSAHATATSFMRTSSSTCLKFSLGRSNCLPPPWLILFHRSFNICAKRWWDFGREDISDEFFWRRLFDSHSWIVYFITHEPLLLERFLPTAFFQKIERLEDYFLHLFA